jgi:hypothetical protein
MRGMDDWTAIRKRTYLSVDFDLSIGVGFLHVVVDRLVLFCSRS